MELQDITEVSKKYNITPKECYDVLLKQSTIQGVKIMHNINQNIIVPKRLLRLLNNKNNYLMGKLTTYENIHKLSKFHIPFDDSGYIYYLFNKEKLIYIGQTTNIAQRIGSHLKSDKIFDKIYTEKTNSDELLLIEALYIYRDLPEININIMDRLDYFNTIIKMINFDDVITN